MNSCEIRPNSFNYKNKATQTENKDANRFIHIHSPYHPRTYVKAAAVTTLAAALIAGLAIALYNYAQPEGSFNDLTIQDLKTDIGEKNSALDLNSENNIEIQNDLLQKINKTACSLILPEGHYEGECVDGQPEGNGKKTWTTKKYEGHTFDGVWKQGNRQHGTYRWPNGDWYEGPFQNNHRHGQDGTYRWANGNVYKGQWEKGDMHGHGRFEWPNGNWYEGQLQNNKRHGQGTFKWADGDVYKGQWKKDDQHGYGTYKFSDGRVYKGNYKNDLMHGQGDFRWPNGNSYVGLFEDGYFHGQGTLIWDGRNYTGQWVDDSLGDFTLSWED